MDDLEFRRRILSDPKQKDEEILQALAASDANSKFVDDVLDLDAKIKPGHECGCARGSCG